MDLLKLLKEEEDQEGVKMGYLISCFRSGDRHWKVKDFGDNWNEGMVKDLIDEDTLTKEEIIELIEDKIVFRNSCCDTYYAVAVY